jgi:hypothetical protein
MGLKDEIDRKYDIFNNEEDFYRATLESTNYMANLGMFTTLWNYGAAMLGSPELGREWVNRDKLEAIGGPTVGLLKDLMNTAELIVQDGDITSEKQLNNFRTFLPFMAIPGISEGGKYLAEELGD